MTLRMTLNTVAEPCLAALVCDNEHTCIYMLVLHTVTGALLCITHVQPLKRHVSDDLAYTSVESILTAHNNLPHWYIALPAVHLSLGFSHSTQELAAKVLASTALATILVPR